MQKLQILSNPFTDLLEQLNSLQYSLQAKVKRISSEIRLINKTSWQSKDKMLLTSFKQHRVKVESLSNRTSQLANVVKSKSNPKSEQIEKDISELEKQYSLLRQEYLILN